VRALSHLFGQNWTPVAPTPLNVFFGTVGTYLKCHVLEFLHETESIVVAVALWLSSLTYLASGVSVAILLFLPADDIEVDPR
jgi:hypothetical protein